MKLIIQIPCYNEAEYLGATIGALPREVPGFDTVEWLVIDDGSEDRTAEIAESLGVDHVLRLAGHKGLATAFMAGIEECLRRGADVIVNTDADNQYYAGDIPLLTGPILEHRAEMVIGTRPIDSIAHSSPVKRLLQKIGSWAVRVASSTDVPDSPSGFRAFSRAAAQRLAVINSYTYTLETVIQAGQSNMSVATVPVRVNGETRPSRLVSSSGSYVARSIATIVRIFVVYRPFYVFGTLGGILLVLGLLLGVRFLLKYFAGEGDGHVQSLILAAVFLVTGFQTVLVAFVADLLAANRKLLEDLRARVSRLADRRPDRSGQ